MAIRLAQGGKLGIGPDSDGAIPEEPGRNTQVAPDFRYDKTGLPRYDVNVKQVASALSTDPKLPAGNYGSSADIITNSDFDSVVSWYKQKAPSGWNASVLDDMDALAAQSKKLTDALGAMLTGAQPSASGAADSSSQPASTPAAQRKRIALFMPPPNTPGDLGIMIVQVPGQPVMVMMKTVVNGAG